MQTIPVSASLESAGHYAQLVSSGSLYFMSGQLPAGMAADTSAEAQLDEVMKRIIAILGAAGLDLSHVVKTTIFITDVSYWPAINARYASHFGVHKPARSIVPVAALHYGYKLEMELIAEKR